MSTEIDKTTVETFVGDTCEITIENLNDIIGETLYLGVRDRKNNEPVFDEIPAIVNNNGEVTFTITPKDTNKFVVKPCEGVNYYYYGVKKVDENTGAEDTILLGDNPKMSDRYLIKVYLKKAEGIVEVENDG